MLKKLAFIFLTIAIITTFNVFADEGNVTVTSTTDETVSTAVYNGTTTSTSVESTSAGVSPDSFIYSLDKLIEKIQLFLIKDSVKEAEFLAKIAQERLAESKIMMEYNKTDLAEKALIEYKDTLDKAIDNLDTAMAAGKEVSKVAEQIATAGMNNTQIVNAIIEKTPDQYKEQVKQAIDKIVENAEITHEISVAVDDKDDKDSDSIKKELEKNIIAAKVTDKAVLDRMKQENLNLRQMTAVVALAEQTKKPLSEVLDTFLANGKGLGATAQALGVAPKDAMKGINKTFKQAKSELKQVYKNTSIEKEEDDKEIKEAVADTVTSASVTASSNTVYGSVYGSEAKLQQKLQEAKKRISEIKGEDKSKEQLEKKVEKEKAKLEKRIEKAKEKQEKFEKHKNKGKNKDHDKNEEDKDDEHEGSDD